ncbi:hypothetical protein Pth03_59540 [Planotetraspora thailandica]|uniref:Uncharacterized protein n=1 Tax=Planotetraspora thailandica TaxID=487172 RepID=A0A8J3V7P7_9ACTN|nr:hypothetical protein [Planotetraspora thailandica]GII57565.1 hypothetical protein Pth03_59540 [Planotetraspora thailandica]
MDTPALAGSEEPEAWPQEPGALLAETDALRSKTRMQLRGSWVPLLGFGLMSLAAVPFARYAFNFGAHGRSVASYPAFAYAELKGLCVVHVPGTPCNAHEFDGAILQFVAWGLWFLLLPLDWLAFARWYRRRGESRGILPRRARWVWATRITLVLVMLALLALLFIGEQPWEAVLIENAYTCPWYVVGVGLLVLGLLERSWITAVAGLCHAALLSAYLSSSWGAGWLPWAYPAESGWTDGPQFKAFLLAAILLVAGLAEWGSAMLQRAPRTTALITRTT